MREDRAELSGIVSTQLQKGARRESCVVHLLEDLIPAVTSDLADSLAAFEWQEKRSGSNCQTLGVKKKKKSIF